MLLNGSMSTFVCLELEDGSFVLHHLSLKTLDRLFQCVDQLQSSYGQCGLVCDINLEVCDGGGCCRLESGKLILLCV